MASKNKKPAQPWKVAGKRRRAVRNEAIRGGPSTIAGNGAFALEDFKAGELVCVHGGVIVSREAWDARDTHDGDFHAALVPDGRVLVPELASTGGHLCNHSCNPNCMIGEMVAGVLPIISLRSIGVGEEITVYYGGQAHAFECKCGSEHCAGTVGVGNGRVTRDTLKRHFAAAAENRNFAAATVLTQAFGYDVARAVADEIQVTYGAKKWLIEGVNNLLNMRLIAHGPSTAVRVAAGV